MDATPMALLSAAVAAARRSLSDLGGGLEFEERALKGRRMRSESKLMFGMVDC